MSDKKRGQQKGAQTHAEGQQGEKTRERLQETLQSSPVRPPAGEEPAPRDRHGDPATSRLFARREQHDEAELNSEKTRLSRDIERHDHVRENFQVVGGAEAHPAMPGSSISPTQPDRPNPSEGIAEDERPERA